MKTNTQITAIVTVLFMAFSTLNAQSPARTTAKERDERPTVQKARTNQVQKKQTQTRQTQARQTQTRQTQARQTQTRQTQARQTQARQTYARDVNTKNAIRPNTTRYGQTASRDQVAYKTPAKTNTHHTTTKPNHGKTYANRPMKNNKYTKERYYSGKHYHNAHPAKKVKTHYHYDTHHHHYKVLYYPAYYDIYWTRNMYRDYNRWYPNYRWRYNYGYRIHTISIFDAKYNLGEVAMVYGRVSATWHNRETDDYLLFFGGDYPGQQFTVILPGRLARKYSWRPERYFLGEHMTVTGLITTFDGIPEIIVKNKQQVGIY